MQIATTGGRATEVAAEAVEQLKAQVRGPVLQQGDAGYDEAREIWNAMIDRKPALIVRCSGVADVILAIKFAAANELLTAIRGGGHNIAGKAVCDDGIVIDLSNMKSVHVDPTARRAYVGPGATLGDVDHETQAFGLATPLGINSTTGAAGLTLGGGFGWLTREHGLTIDNLLSADVVTPAGELVTASADDNADLFWAIRGGGGNFGVVTNFVIQLHPVGPEIFAGLFIFPFDQAKSLLGQYRSLAAGLSNTENVWTVMRKAPPLPFLPESVHGTEVLIFAMFSTGGQEAGERLASTIRGLGQPAGEHAGMMPYVAWQQAFDPLLTPGARNYWKSHNFAQLDDGLFDAIIEYIGTLPSAQTEIFIGLLGGKANEVAADQAAYGHRDAEFVLNVHGRWDSAAEDEGGIAWARAFFKASEPFADGSVYVNFMTEDETDRVGAAYGSNYERLADVKRKFDPKNLLRLNHNIKP